MQKESLPFPYTHYQILLQWGPDGYSSQGAGKCAVLPNSVCQIAAARL